MIRPEGKLGQICQIGWFLSLYNPSESLSLRNPLIWDRFFSSFNLSLNVLIVDKGFVLCGLHVNKQVNVAIQFPFEATNRLKQTMITSIQIICFLEIEFLLSYLLKKISIRKFTENWK